MPQISEKKEINGRAHLCIWQGMSESDQNGESLSLPGAADKSVQVVGTFGGTTITIQGSNLEQPQTDADWDTLNDRNGNALSFTSRGIRAIGETTLHMRPRADGGTSVNVDVRIVSRTTF